MIDRKIKKYILWRIAHLLRPYIEKEIESQNMFSLLCTSGGRIGKLSQIEGIQYITIGANFHAGNCFRLCAIDEYHGETFTPKLEIGDDVSFEDYCHVGCVEHIQIGNNCMFASKVFIEDHCHGSASNAALLCAPPAERKLIHKPVIIGNNVFVGDGVCIMAGITLGDNIIVGANAVVTHSFPPNSVIAGVPARIIRTLNVL